MNGTPMRQWAVAAVVLAAGLGCGVAATKGAAGRSATRPRRTLSRHEESFEHLRAYGKTPYAGYCYPGFHYWRLAFNQEYLNGPPAFVVFCHNTSTYVLPSIPLLDDDEYDEYGPAPVQAQRASRPDIWLDGRGIPSEALTKAQAAKGLAKADPLFLRIRPGSHDLHVQVKFRTAYKTRGKFDWTKAKVKSEQPLKKTVSLRPGDMLMVLTGVGGEKHGVKVAVLPQEKTMPHLKGVPIPTAAKVLSDTQARATRGEPAAVYDVGVRRLLAIDLPQDTARGRAMIRAAAKAGHAPAMVMLGDLEMLRVGLAKGKDRSRIPGAKQWYERALAAGSRAGGRQLLRELNLPDKSADKKAVATEKARIQARMAKLPPQPFGIRQSQFGALLRRRPDRGSPRR